MNRFLILIIFCLTLAPSTYAFESKCKIKYNVTMFEDENSTREYRSCSLDFFADESRTTTRSQVFRGLSKTECHEQAQQLLDQKTEVQFLEMVVGTEGLYSACTGYITKIKKIKYKK